MLICIVYMHFLKFIYTYINDTKLSHLGHSCWKCMKKEMKHIEYMLKKCFSNRKEVCLLKDNLKKIGSAFATLHELDVIFIAGYSACRFP